MIIILNSRICNFRVFLEKRGHQLLLLKRIEEYIYEHRKQEEAEGPPRAREIAPPAGR